MTLDIKTIIKLIIALLIIGGIVYGMSELIEYTSKKLSEKQE